MAKHKPLAVTTAENQLVDLQRQWDKHLKLCRDCIPLTDTRNRYCDQGWQIVKAAQQARAVIREHDHQDQDQQDRLF